MEPFLYPNQLKVYNHCYGKFTARDLCERANIRYVNAHMYLNLFATLGLVRNNGIGEPRTDSYYNKKCQKKCRLKGSRPIVYERVEGVKIRTS